MPELDGLRGFAALAVFAFHGYFLSNWPADQDQPAWLAGQRLMSLGWSGVDIFFTLSAFLLSLSLLQRAASDGAAGRRSAGYLQRRALRIFPAFWAQIAVLALLSSELPRGGVDLVAQLGLLFNLGAHPVSPWVPVWWTLPVEFGFYLVLPLLVPLLRAGRWQWLLLGIVGAWLYRYQLLHADLPKLLRVTWAEHLPGRIDQFLIGMLGAYAWHSGAIERLVSDCRRLTWLALAGMFAWCAVHALPFALASRAGPSASTHPALIGWHGMASLALLPVRWACARGGSLPLRWLGSEPCRGLGAISFSLYLWHSPLMMLVRPLVPQLPAGPARPFLFTLMLLLPCLALAWVSWRLIERPAMRWSRSTATAATAQSA